MTRQAFERLIRQHKDAVYRQMVRVCAHREDAEDALATAMMLAFRASDQLGSDEAFRSWLGTIGKRVCTRMRSSPGIQEALDYAEERGLVGSGSDDFDLQILKGCVQQAVEEIPELFRPIYMACEIEGRTVPEAAEKLGLSEAAAKSRLLRARALIRERLDHSICAV